MGHQPEFRGLFAAISLALISGCHGVTEPITPGTTFVLESVGGARLPAVSGIVPSGTVFIADTLIFLSRDDEASGQVVHYQTVRLGSTTTHSSYELRYTWHNGVLSFYWPPCPPFADCVNVGRSTPVTGRFGPGSLTITYGTPTLFPLTYRRLN